MCGADELIAVQQGKAKASLVDCWQQAKVNIGDFVVSRGVLYHKDKVEKLPICQLCVPQSQYVHKLKWASDCHLRVCETTERSRLLCYWHEVYQGMHSCVRSCTSLRLRSRPTKADPCATSRTLMLIVRRHVPDKLDWTTPITTTFLLAATVSREVTLTFFWQLMMPMNCIFVTSDILLL